MNGEKLGHLQRVLVIQFAQGFSVEAGFGEFLAKTVHCRMAFNACDALLELLTDGIDARLIYNALQFLDLRFNLVNCPIVLRQKVHVAPILDDMADGVVLDPCEAMLELKVRQAEPQFCDVDQPLIQQRQRRGVALQILKHQLRIRL